MVVLAALTQSCTRPASEPSITVRKAPAGLILPPRFEAALARYAPAFRRWQDSEFIASVKEGYPYTQHQAPSAVIGDFNSDGVLDAAVLGKSGSERVLLALIDTAGSVRISELERSPHVQSWINTGARSETGEWVFLRLKPIREATRCAGVIYQDRSGEAIVIEYFGKAATVHYLDSTAGWQKGCGGD